MGTGMGNACGSDLADQEARIDGAGYSPTAMWISPMPPRFHCEGDIHIKGDGEKHVTLSEPMPELWALYAQAASGLAWWIRRRRHRRVKAA
jgi:hypothetical protein